MEASQTLILEEIRAALAGHPYVFKERDALQLIEAPMAQLKAASPEDRLEFVLAALAAMPTADLSMQYALKGACSALLRRGGELPLGSHDAVRMVESLSHRRVVFPYKAVLSAIETSAVPMTTVLAAALTNLKPHIDEWIGGTEMRELHARIDQMLQGPSLQSADVEAAGEWSRIVLQETAATQSDGAWKALFRHTQELTQSAASKKWQKEAVALINAIGRKEFLEAAQRWLALGPMPNPPAAGVHQQVPDAEADYQKGFVWALGALGDTSIAPAIGDFAFACFRKIPMIGAVSHRVGNACVHALAAMPGLDAVSQLSRLAAKVKYDVARRLIEQAFTEAAVRNGVSREDLEAMSVPTFGLDPQTGVRVEEHAGIDDIEARLEISADGGAVLTWIRDGKPLKSMPAAMKTDELAIELKKTAKELDAALSTQRIRLERQLLSESFCAFDRWREWYVEHPVVGFFARRLIWEVESADGSICTTVLPLDGRLVDWAGQAAVDCGGDAKVRLWHPIRGCGGNDAVQTVLSWRCFLEDHGIRQPFKQAHREVYLLTSAERETATFSTRFAAHIVRQHPFAALCRERAWDFRLMGAWDSHNIPTLALPQYKLAAEFDVDFPRNLEEISGHAIYLAIRTGQVRFRRMESRNFLRLEEVPPVVFSEVMRDCDLFTGVASIGADPAWGQMHTGADEHREYWHEFAFGELSTAAEHRRSILSALLPKLAIRERCRIDGRFLWVRGNLHEYRIHLGSGNVIREPGSQYLCIVQGGGDSAAKVALPFEGDRILSLILSKAFLLAEDSKIRDESIRRQLQ